jgi:hypothetical protein
MSRKSKSVPATLVVAVAATLIANGCGSFSDGVSDSNITEVRRCVDQNGKILPDSYCQGPVPHNSTIVTFGSPQWVYGGNVQNNETGGGGASVGSTVKGYQTAPTEGADVVSSQGVSVGHASGGVVSAGGDVSRGGFGEAGEGHGGGGGE